MILILDTQKMDAINILFARWGKISRLDSLTNVSCRRYGVQW